jgi:hypothetical protein
VSALGSGSSVLRLARRLGTGLVLIYALCSLTLGGTPAARPIWLSLAASWSILVGAVHLRPTVGWFKPLGGLELVATNVAVTLVLAEVSLHWFAPWAGPSLLVSDQLDAHRLVPGRDYGAGLRGNALGYPGPDFARSKSPGVFRIAALGDSFAVGPAVPWAENYLTLLQAALPRTEVYNFGVSGAGPREYELILRRDVWTYQPDLVLLSVFVGNDITETMATPRHLDPRGSALYLLLSRSWRLLRERGAAPAPDRLAGPALSEAAFREVEGRRLAVCLDPPPPGLEKKWQAALGHLDRLATDCQRHGVPLAVVLIPDEFQVNPAVLALAREEANVAPQRVDLERPQRCLLQFCQERGVPCLDLRPAFQGTTAAYAPRDTHWNTRGNRLAAAAIASWIGRMRSGRE